MWMSVKYISGASALAVDPEKRKAVVREEADFAGDCTWGRYQASS
jgi:hypothetical protein